MAAAVLAGFTAALGAAPAGAEVAHDAPPLTWDDQAYPGNQPLEGISCPTASACWAVGKQGTIVSTADSGGTWTKETSNTSVLLSSISCSSTSSCTAVGTSGTVLATIDGGATWTPQASGTSDALNAVSCPTPGHCWAAGNGGVVISTVGGDGNTWTVQSHGGANLYGISCADANDCVVAGFGGAILATSDGSTWAPVKSATSTTLRAVSCADADHCWAAGGSTIVSTTDGSTWTTGTGPSDGGSNLGALACTDVSDCWAAGMNPGAVVATGDGGSSWTLQMPDVGNWLNGLACANNTHCWAVGNGVIMSGFAAPQNVDPSRPAYDSDAPDPDIVSADGTYYTFTTGTRAAPIIQELSSGNLASWNIVGSAIKRIPSWQKAGTQEAPGVFQWNGKYIMYYAAIQSSTNTRCISMATSSTISGPYSDTTIGPLECDANLGGALDPQPFVDASGNAYLYWKSNDGLSGVNAQIWVAPVTSAGLPEVASARSILTQDQPGTTEAPFMVSANGAYYLFYSIGNWNSAGYGVAYATCASAEGPCTGVQVDSILSSTTNVLGPGSPSVVTDGTGRMWMAYCGWSGPTSQFSYSKGDYRSLWLAPLGFSGGTPYLNLSSPPPAPQPSVAGLATATGPTSGGTSVVISGSHLSGSLGVDFGNLPAASFTADSDSQITAVTPPTSASTVDVTVTTADGTSAASCADQFTFSDGGPANGAGYRMATTTGAVYSCGSLATYGSESGKGLSDFVTMISTTDHGGYWLVGSDGSVDGFGDAGYFGSMGGKPLSRPVVGAAVTHDGLGYWLVASDGGIFAFGDAAFFGSTGDIHLNKPIVGMIASGDALGYLLVASDGGIFAFGDAAFFGSMGGKPLNMPVVAVDTTPSGRGYLLVASDGGTFAFGDAAFFGSTGNIHLNRPIVGILASNDALGYLLVASDGGIFAFGDAAFFGSMGAVPVAGNVVAIAA